jgi:hypothetical protein
MASSITPNPAAPPPVTEEEYWDLVQLLTIEIEDAIVIHHTAEAINRLALDDTAVLEVLNQDPLFWQTYVHCLQTSLFLTLSRIFDVETEAHSIHSLLNATLANIQLFSESALRARKTKGGIKAEWLETLIGRAWFPSAASDLRHLKVAVRPHMKLFEDVYRPIRHAIFAHRLMSDAKAGATLFQATSRDDVTGMLDFLHDLIETITHLYMNGFAPELGKRDFKESNQRIRDGAASALNRRR